MHFYEACPSIICIHNILDVIHTLGAILAKKNCPNFTPMCNLFLPTQNQQRFIDCTLTTYEPPLEGNMTYL